MRALIFNVDVSLTPTVRNSLRYKVQDLRLWWRRTWLGKWFQKRADERADRAFWAAEWPKKGSGPEFGLTTAAKPREGVEQDADLTRTVETMLRNAHKCPSCGR